MVAGGVVVVVVGAVVVGVVVVGFGVVVVGATVVVAVVLGGVEVVVVGATVEVLTDEVEPVLLLQAAIKGNAISSTAVVRIRVRFMCSSNNLILNDFTYEVKKREQALLQISVSASIPGRIRALHVERRGGRKTPLLSCLNPEVRRVFSPTTSMH